MVQLVGWTGCGSDEPSMAEALKKADEAEKARKEAEAKKKESIKVEKKTDVLELPWTIDALKEMPMGTVATYSVSGLDAKGKEVTDTYIATFKGGDDKSARVNEFLVSNKEDPVSSQVKTLDWSQLSPLFSIERPESKVLRRETVEVPAGSFETVVVDINGFFGAHNTVWMIADKPGVYAKVEKHANANEEGDQTAMVFQLESVEVK
jgi:hypothetical protein